MNEKLKLLLLISGLFIISVFISSFFIYKSYKMQKDIYLQTMTNNLEALYENNAYLLKEISNIIFDSYINKDNVIKIVANTSKIKDKKSEELKKLREKLYKELYEKYNYMKNYGLQELHFHFSDYTSFLRFYRPEKYGDSLKGIRKSLEIVQETKKPVSCFEVGRVVHGFRNVYPLFYKGNFIGTVDVAYHANSIISVIEKTLPVYIEFIINKNLIQKRLFKDEQKAYIESHISEEFFIDKDVKIFNKEAQKIKEEIKNIDKKSLGSIKNNLKNGKNFSTNLKIKDKDYLVTFICVKDCEDKSSAYFVIYKPDKFFEHIYNSFILTLVTSIFLLTLMFLILYVYFWGQITHKEKLKKISETDILTGIANRRAFVEKIKDVVKTSSKLGNPLSVILFDIDNFKKVNDIYGHDVGDYVLKEISKIISGQLRKTDFFARWGGEEFMIILENTDLKEAAQIAERLRRTIEVYEFEKVGNITISLGVAELKRDEDIDAFLKRLDELLYKAKRKGKNRVEFE